MKKIRLALMVLCAGAAVYGLAVGLPRLARVAERAAAGPVETPSAPGEAPLAVCYGVVDCRNGPLALLPLRPGRVVEIHVREGQRVTKGTPLLQIDDRLAQSRKEEAELGVRASELILAKAKNGLVQYEAKVAQQKAAIEVVGFKMPLAEAFLLAKEKLFKDGIVNQSEVEAARSQIDELKALERVEKQKMVELKAVDPQLEVDLAQVQLDRSRQTAEQAKLDLDEHVLRAPLDAEVLRVMAQKGDLQSPQAGRPAFLLVPQGPFIVRAEVSQEFAPRIRPEVPVVVEDEASVKPLAKGTIREVGEAFLPRRLMGLEPNRINTGLVLEIIVDLNPGETEKDAPRLRIGQRVRVRVLPPKSKATTE